MANFKEIFKGKKHVFLPVIHVEDAELALHNVQIAKNNGADGVFLINHRIPWQELLQCYAFVKEKIPDFWIGMNFLDRENYQALHALPKSASGLWIDDGGIREDSRKPDS